MNHLFKPFLILIVFSSLFLSCDQEQEPIPSYLHISKFTLNSNPLTQGLNTADIISAKVYVNGAEIGTFELPATFPVIATGNAEVIVFPNIKENASSNSQKYFKPYESFTQTVNLEAGKIDSLKPKISYRSNANFRWMEDFEDQAISIVKSGANSTNDSFYTIPTSTPGVDQPFSGSNYCGFINVSNDSFVVFERSTLSTFNDIPFLGTDVYVELDIKSNINVQVGVYSYIGADYDQAPVMVINSTAGKWKKIYVNLKPQIGDLTSGTPIRLFFGFYKEDNDKTDYKVYLDNLKLVYLN
jgi:hypothetical protein